MFGTRSAYIHTSPEANVEGAAVGFRPVPAGSPSRGGDVAVNVFDINQPRLPIPFHYVLVSVSGFMALSTCIPFILPTTLDFLSLFFRSYFCLIGPFHYISLYESLLQL